MKELKVMKQNILINIRVLAIVLACLTVCGVDNAWGTTTYKLTQITSASSIVSDGIYVFEEEDGDFVIIPNVSSSSLQTTSTYATSGLTGSESYLWKITETTGGWYLRKASDDTKYFRNSSSTTISFSTSDQTNNVWTIHYYSDKTVSIDNNGTSRKVADSGYGLRTYPSSGSGSATPTYFKLYILEEECSNSVTINKGTGTNCTFDLGTTGAQASCDGVSTSVSITPNTGYGNPVVSQSGASAAPTITGTGTNSQTVTYAANTTGTSTINVSCSANTYTVTLNDNTGSGGSGSKTVTYNANTNLTTNVAKPTKDHHDFAGYWTSTDNGATFDTQLVNADCSWIASVANYTDGSKNWIKADNVTLYAKWTEHSLTNYRTVCCTPLTTVSGAISVGSINETGGTASWSWSGATTGISKNILKVYNTSDVLVKTIDNISASATSQSISGLDPCTSYYVTLTTVASSGYCAGEEQGKSSNFTTNGWAVHYTGGDENEGALLSNVTKVTGASQACLSEDYVATFTANTGYKLPDAIVVYIAGVEVDVDDAYTWSISNGTGTLTVETDDLSEEIDIRIIGECVSPVIGTDPADASYQQGASPSALTVAATLASGTLTYQWQKSTDGGSNWSNESGTGYNTATYAAANISTASVGTTKYRCIVGNSEGGCTVTSAVATITITAAANFVNGTTVFIQAESSSAWDASACVKAWFNNNGAGGAAQTTYWLFDATGVDAGKKLYATVVPADGDVNQVTLQRFASNCSDFYNANGTLTKASDGGSNIFCSNGSGNSNVSWKATALTMNLMSSDAWNTPVATVTDQGAGVWSGTYEYTPTGTSTDYVIATNYNGNLGNTGINPNATLSGMIVGSTYNVTATMNVVSHTLTMSKTFVKGEVSFDLQGHGSPISKLTNVTNGSTISAPSEPSVFGYTFGGWFTDPECTDEWDFENDEVSETMTLYAKWTANVYTITKTFSNVANAGLPASFTYTGSTTTALNSTFTVDATNFFLPSSIAVTMGGTPLTVGTDYTYNNSTGAFTFDVTITGNIVITASATAKLKSIAITTQPTTRAYLVGETFSTAGAVVTATMGDGSTKAVTASATWTPAGALSAGTSQTVTASYTENGINQTATTTIDVYSVTVNKVAALDGTAIDAAGVTATCTTRALAAGVSTTNYIFNNWEFDGSNNGLTITSTTSTSTSLTGTPTGNVTIKAVFYKPITVTWKVGNGPASGGTTEVKYNTAITALPSTPADDAIQANCGANKFMGWTKNGKIEGEGHDAPADLFTTVGGATNLTTNTTYRAVFATRGPGYKDTTIVEDFQKQSTGTIYNSTVEKSADDSNAGIGWYIYYGTISSSDPLVGTKSAQMRWYKSSKDNYPYLKDTTQLLSLSNIKFKAQVGNTDVKMDVAWSSNKGVSWTNVATGETFANTKKTAFSYDIPGAAGTKYIIKIGVSNASTAPSGTYYSLKVDSVAFTYKTPTTITADYITGCCTPLAAIGGAVEFTNPTTAVLTWNNMSNVDATTPYTITYRTGSDPYGSSNVSDITTNGAGKKTCTITGLSCNTAYDFKIAVKAAEDYCNIDSVMTATSTKYSITKDVVTGGSCTTKISTDDVTEACNGATILIAATPSAGYEFSSWTITKAGGGTVDPAASSASTSFTMPSDDVTVTPNFSCIVPNHIDITGRWDRFGGETISLTATAYATAGTESPIPAADITGYKWQKWYNEQWNDVSDGGNISGTSTNNLVITNSIGGNSGSYRCVVTTGATCPAYSSDGREVKVFALECYTGGTTSYNFTRDGENERGSVEVTLAANTAYTFKIHADNVYYGNTGTVNEDVTDWLCTIGAGNLTVNSGLGGTFTFTMDYSSAGSSSTVGDPEISVTYPRKTIYLTPGEWNVDGAKFAFYYFRKEGGTTYGKGFTDFITAGDCGSSAEIPQWNGVQINAVRLNSNTTASDLTNPADNYAAAWAKKWNQTSDITISSYNSITITGMGGGGDSPYTYGDYTIPTYTISYATGSTTYTGGNAISGSKASESKTCGEDFTLPNAAVFTTTGYTQTGWATSDGGSQAYAFGGTYSTNAAQTFYPVWTANTHSLSWSANGGDALTGDYTTGTVAYGTTIVAPDTPTKTGYTFAGWHNGTGVVTPATTMPDNDLSYTAQWNLATYTVTLETNGGTINAGNVTSYTYGTGATLPTNVTRDGYRFDGWFDNVGLTGDVVTTISSSATGDKAFWAKWTKIHTVTWNVNGSTYNTGVVEGNTHVINGGKISAPATAPADNTLSACASKFMGWSCKNFGSTPKTTESGQYDDLFTDVAGSPYITQDITFYAVFAEQTNSDGYKYIGDDGTLADGKKYIFVSAKTAGSAHALKATDLSENSSGGKKGTSVGVTITSKVEGILVTSENSALEFEYVSSGTKLKYVDGVTTKYLFVNGNGVGYKTGDSRSAYGTHQLYGWTNGGSNRYVYYDGTNDNFTISEDAQNMYAFIKQTPTYGNYRTQCDANLVKVTYDADGGSTTCADGSHDKRNDYTVCATEPTRDYYTFDGWLCSADDEVYLANATIDADVIDDDFTLTAQWTPVPYDITYNLYGGTNSGSNPATYNVETATITLQDPTKGHDRFEGWFSTYSAGVYSDQVTSIPLGSHGDITLHAKWAERHEIIFDADGTTTTIYRADDEDLSASVAGQGSVPDDPDAPSACSSKVFVGWSESEIDDETDDEPADLMKPAAGTVNADKHYYAVWAIESSESGTVYLYNGAFEQVTSGTAYGDKGKWETSTVFGTGTAGEVRMSSNSSSGSMDLDLSDKTLATSITVTFKMKRYGTEAGSVTLSCMDDGSTASFGSSPFSYPSGDDNWHDYSSTVTSVNAKTQSIHFTSTSGKRVYVKDVVVSQIGTVYNYSAYSTSCCATKVTLSQNDPEHGTIVFGKTSVGTCGDKEVSLTITPAAGYQLHSYEVATGDGKVGTKSVSPDIALDNNSNAAQNITLTFAEDANGAYAVTASFTEMVANAWTWTKHVGGATITTDPVEVYVGQKVQVDVSYEPAGLLSNHTNASAYNYSPSPWSNPNLGSPAKAGDHLTVTGTNAGSTSVVLNHNDGLTKTINYTVLALPLVHFVDNIHGEPFANVVATVSGDQWTVTTTRPTPTHSAVDDPGASYNTCERQHLHLVGWILSTWADAHPNAEPGDITGAGAGNYYAAGADIDLVAQNGKTFYAVWAKFE